MADSLEKRLGDMEARLKVLDALVDHLLALDPQRPEALALRSRLEGLRDNSGDQDERDMAERMLKRLGP